MDKKLSQSIILPQGGLLNDLTLRAKLFFQLWADPRVSAWAKLIPMGALIYFISPLDIIPGDWLTIIGLADDAAILWLGYHAFIEMCPPDVVRELAKKLVSNTAIVDEVKKEAEEEIVDGEARDVTDQ
jgi:uncharacterized membrane protein YkvA (DUF1232 family)